MDISEDFHFVNRKRNLFLLFTLSPTLIGSIWVFLYLGNSEVFYKPSGTTFNYVVYILFALQFLFFIFFRQFRRLFELNTHISFSNNYVTIQESGSFFPKKKLIKIGVEEINYLQVNDYSQMSSKSPSSISFNISYTKKRYCAHIQLDANGKIFFNYVINYLKSRSNEVLNSSFYFKPHWMHYDVTKKIILSMVFATIFLFFILLFSLEKKSKAFSSLFIIGISMQLYAKAKEMEIVYNKIRKNDSPFV